MCDSKADTNAPQPVNNHDQSWWSASSKNVKSATAGPVTVEPEHKLPPPQLGLPLELLQKIVFYATLQDPWSSWGSSRYIDHWKWAIGGVGDMGDDGGDDEIWDSPTDKIWQDIDQDVVLSLLWACRQLRAAVPGVLNTHLTFLWGDWALPETRARWLDPGYSLRESTRNFQFAVAVLRMLKVVGEGKGMPGRKGEWTSDWFLDDLLKRRPRIGVYAHWPGDDRSVTNGMRLRYGGWDCEKDGWVAERHVQALERLYWQEQ